MPLTLTRPLACYACSPHPWGEGNMIVVTLSSWREAREPALAPLYGDKGEAPDGDPGMG
ncbi:MAG TPA: hypothetical protein VGC70_02235 [Burkholderiales bacterium]